MIERLPLDAFLAVSATRHFGRAAEQLGVAQSVVSKRIRRLEDILGVRLFDRGARSRVELTRIGRLFEPEARKAVTTLVSTERVGKNLGRGSHGPLRLGYVFSAAMSGLLPRLITRIVRDLPDVDIQPQLLDTPRQLAMIEGGELDVAITRPRPSYPAVASARIAWREGLIVAMAAHSPLARRRRLRAVDLAAHTFIVPQFHEQVGLLDAVRALADNRGMAMPALKMTDDFITAAALAGAGAGIVLAPRSLSNLGMAGLRFKTLADYEANLDLMAVFRRDAPEAASAAIQSELDLIASGIPQA